MLNLYHASIYFTNIIRIRFSTDIFPTEFQLQNCIYAFLIRKYIKQIILPGSCGSFMSVPQCITPDCLYM